jgi:uroporphyrin-III C-methyltransferase/precorrin-2 dehydrogenase/sirohydrochlorin ferrochelatase
MSGSVDYLPLFHDVRGANALVVGGGTVASRKIRALLTRGAAVTVVAETFSDPVRERIRRGDIRAIEGRFSPGHLDGATLVFAATSDALVNAGVSREAKRRNIPVNVADAPELCSFILPAIVPGEEYTLAVSTGGKNPGAARSLREFLEKHREEVSVRLELGRRRRQIAARKGKVYIVGAGPGNPDLLTVRALGLLRSADAVIYDYLVAEEILSLSPARAVKLCYARKGRTAGHGAALKQIAIHEAMVRLAREGRSVVRLKSGDPLVFGRGGEEAEHLAREGVEFEIVPGITAAMGCAASARIPLTRRDLASSITFVAGHESDGKGGSAIDWNRLPKDGTLAVYMGVSRVEAIAAELMDAGFAPDTPFAVVENGTRPEQRVLRGILAELALVASEKEVRSPAVLFVGRSAGPLAQESFQEQPDESFAQGV